MKDDNITVTITNPNTGLPEAMYVTTACMHEWKLGGVKRKKGKTLAYVVCKYCGKVKEEEVQEL